MKRSRPRLHYWLMMKSRFFLLLALAPGLLSTACGSGEPVAALPHVDACEVFRREDAEAIVGEPMVVTYASLLEDAKKDDPLECLYANQGKPPRALGLLVQPFATTEQAGRIHEATLEQLQGFAGEPPEDLPGLGNKAAWGGGHLRKLFVLAGRYRLVVTSQAEEESVAKEAARAAAARALERLGAS